ncbi:divalent-cation tolerance protein CutA [Streptomyces sp. KR80]|uniref:divalent-cation tolerance protein CutA n=1 Tax=Streptomyces sp. KR80 TaxID=3457426 RepID=UPI003FD423F4
MADHLTVLTTTDSAEEANALARGAVESRLAACAQITAPITSVYRWEGVMRTAQEWQVIFTTSAARYRELEAHIEGTHAYEVPEIIATPIVQGSADYLAWVDVETAVGHDEGPVAMA